jgi:hypothetical protein
LSTNHTNHTNGIEQETTKYTKYTKGPARRGQALEMAEPDRPASGRFFLMAARAADSLPFVWFVRFVDNPFVYFVVQQRVLPARRKRAGSCYASHTIIRVRTGPWRAWLQRSSTSPV